MIGAARSAVVVVCGLSLLTGCVTEKITRPNNAAPSKRAASTSAPMTPLTTRVDPARSASSAAKVALQPLGYVPYDGLVLPLVSPDGKYLATQVGEAPSWEILLAQKDATGAFTTAVEIYELDGMRGRRVGDEAFMLGLYRNSAGFYVESPRSDGSRMIAAVRWKDEGVEWIVDGKGAIPAPPRLADGFLSRRTQVVATNAVAASNDSLAEIWTLASRAPYSDSFTLGTWPYKNVLLDRVPIGEFIATVFEDRERWYCFQSCKGGVGLLVFTRSSGGYISPSSPHSVTLGCDGGPASAYRAAVSASITPERVSGGDLLLTSSLLFYQACRGCMVVLTSSYTPVPLMQGSIAGCWATTKTGPAVLLTTGDGLHMQRLSRDASGWFAEEPIRLLREPYVPRATTDPERPFILLGPGPKDKPEVLQVMAMKLIEE